MMIKNDVGLKDLSISSTQTKREQKLQSERQRWEPSRMRYDFLENNFLIWLNFHVDSKFVDYGGRDSKLFMQSRN